ncbi:19017_t:CDS:1, partial [Racocetra persica]
LSNRIRPESESISTSSSMTFSSGTPDTPSIINTLAFFTNPSTPPKYPSVKKVRSIAALTTLTNDPFRVGAGVEISGIKVRGTVTLNQLSTRYSDRPGSPKSVNELR